MTDEIWTFSDMYKRTTAMAKVLHGAGLKQNDVITIISENRHEYPEIALAAFYLNAIVAPINVTYTERKPNRPSPPSSVSRFACFFFYVVI